MSHFIGLVFTDKENDLDSLLEPFCEESEDYFTFIDETDALRFQYENEVGQTKEETCKLIFPKYASSWDNDFELFKEKCLCHQPSKEEYPTFEDYANDFSNYDAETGKWGYKSNPNAKWDWWSLGGRWENYLTNKEGFGTDTELFNEVDWEKMIEEGNTPFCFVTPNGEWYERGEMGWWARVSNEKPITEWKEVFKEFIDRLSRLSEEDRKEIYVHAVDFHI